MLVFERIYGLIIDIFGKVCYNEDSLILEVCSI